MLGANGRLIRLGDSVTIGGGMNGVVVFSFDTDEFSPEFSKSDWAYLGRGIGIDIESHCVFHYETSSEDLEIIEPASGGSAKRHPPSQRRTGQPRFGAHDTHP